MAPKQVERALIVVRLSRVTDATTSPERQREVCETFAEARGWTVAGVVEDLDISGSVSPFERPALAPYLEAPDFDVIVVWRIDRLTRSMLHLAKIMSWAEEHRVSISSATESHFDTSSAAGRYMALSVASFAEMELEAISERNRSAFAHNFSRGKWRGGVPPWGYLPERVDGEWRLVQDPVQVRVIREVVKRVLAGEGLHPITSDLTRRGLLTSKDRFAESQGRDVEGYSWHVSPLRRALRAETLRGWAVTKGEVVRDAAGAPLVRADPVLDAGTWHRLQARLDATARKSNARQDQALLTGKIFCAVCSKPMWVLRGSSAGRADRYRCRTANTVEPCGNRSITMSVADTALLTMLDQWWDRERTVRERTPGYDPTDELLDIEAELAEIAELVGTRGYRKGDPGRAGVDARAEALMDRREELQAQPITKQGWTEVGTGETLRQWWDTATPEARNGWIRDSGFTMWVDMQTEASRVVTIRMGAYGDDLDIWHRYAMAESRERAGVKGAKREVTKVMREIGKLGQDHLWVKFELA